MKENWIDTPIGPMVALFDEQFLFSLEFLDVSCLKQQVTEPQKDYKQKIILGKTEIFESIKKELKQYFLGELKTFLTPIKTRGTPFQRKVWDELQKIPFGETRSYSDIAKNIKNEKAVRAVGSANGKNQIAIVIPCHRVINASGKIGGYAAGPDRKKGLLEHEVKYGR